MIDPDKPKEPPRAETSFAQHEEAKADISYAERDQPTAETSLPHADEGHAVLSQMPTSPSSVNSAKAATARAPVATGAKLLNRFIVLRYIARGGMGEVYEVEDEITGRRMALKTVLPAVASDPLMIEQLKEEINNARDVTHRNVCRVFEVFEDPSTSPPGYFLTMEYLEGETLSEVLHREGPMSPDRLLPLVHQMAAGLEAVHEAGIVHQDFKTANVMLVGSGSEKRVVVTDFGLAVNMRAKGGGMTGGTPAYMAPEQVDGNTPVDKRADIYAFGVALYELLTARFPIESKTAREVMERKLTDPPVPPSRYAPKLPAHFEKTILRCLERDPALRFGTIDEVMAALEQRAEKRRRRRIALATSGLVLAAVAGIGGGMARRYMVTHRTPTVAVVGLANRTGAEYDWVGTELAEALSTNLAGSKDLKTVPQEDVALVKGEFPGAAGKEMERENLSGFRQAVAADYVIIGDYDADQGAQLTFTLRLQDANGEMVGPAIREQGAEADYQKMVAKASDQLRHRLGSTLLPEAEAEEAANVYPQDDEARHLYFDALSKMRALNAVGALPLLNRADHIEGSNVAIHAAKADALAIQKRFGEARLEARRADELADKAQLPSEYVMLVEARAFELSNDWNNAIQRLDALYRLSRDKLRYGLLLANAQVRASHSNDALQVLGDLANLPKPSGDDPRIAITQAQAYSIGGDYPSEIQAATNALKAAQARKWRLMEASADLQLCWAQQRTQNAGASLASCQQAQGIFASVGDPVNAAVVLNNIANWQMARGNFSEAKQAYENVLRITTKAEDQVDSAGAHLNLAATLLQLNDLAGCREHLDAALKLATAAGDKYDEARARLILADVYRATTGVKDAIAEVEKAQAIAKEIGDQDTEGYAWTNLILYKKDAGDLAGALAAGEHAIAVRSALEDRVGVATAQEFVADVYFQKGELEKARQLYEKALAAHDASERPKLAELWLSLADVDLQSGALTSAAENAGKAASEYHKEKDGDSEADALAVSTKIAIARKDLGRAGDLLKQIDGLNPQDKEVQANAAEAKAEWLIASGKLNEAIALLSQTKPSEEEGRGYSGLESRLTLARARYAAHQQSQATAELAAVRREAQKAGFAGLAQRAIPGNLR